MRNNLLVGSGLIIFSNIIAAVSQILLKKAAKKTWSMWWKAYINPFVIIAYTLFFMTTIFSVFALRFIPLSLSAILGASSQIFVPLFSYLFLKEKISRKRFYGMLLIVIGVVIFAL